ncbi:MAG: DUF2335 domain-containing protein [bacterium]|nr:DUF2335 domain-containing protein [bacterium]
MTADLPVKADDGGETSSDESAQVVSSTSLENFAGPLPPPNVVDAYGDINPGFPERIFALTESSLAHRQAMDRGRSRRSTVGLVAGVVIALSFLGVAAWLINGGHGVFGTILGSVDLVALVSVFVLGHRNGSRRGRQADQSHS